MGVSTGNDSVIGTVPIYIDTVTVTVQKMSDDGYISMFAGDAKIRLPYQ